MLRFIKSFSFAFLLLCIFSIVSCKSIRQPDSIPQPLNYSDEDILDYISREEPYDKAGSYAIQGYFGRYIDRFEGDYENVVGLPFYRIEPLIQAYI